MYLRSFNTHPPCAGVVYSMQLTDPSKSAACRLSPLRRPLASASVEWFSRKKHCPGLWLVSGFGHEDEAHRYYKDFGFEVTGYRFVKRF
ncbi:MAG: hypothetical protein A9Z00_15080 [Thermobacillus sp. ZCTH02-B1]|uniref:hypothetical protein n=1 Tax=Thermobacillus sp. ZCTH02-B1 TaxID=1858795 RepID=UPI000B551260|nr:hypothetical protein [Thermobacillus sp. ZCTH02-B1]OUM94754.1 MAG: hypothetical protein A9Z00_15080 [Thermobacillus sp. ZCTH02-B1]